METVLTIEGLKKSYRASWRKPPRAALNGLDLQVPRGSITGLLGPNGAGKTTTLKSIMGLLRPQEGKIRIFGEDGPTAESRARMGFLPEQPYFDMYFSPRKLLRYYAKLAGLSKPSIDSRTSYLLNRVGLEKEADLTLEKFSRGMLQRLGLAQALIAEPEFLILDEPSGGLDPRGKIRVKELLEDLRKRGVTILLSSHQLSEIEEVCDGIAIIDRGRNVASGPLDKLLGSRDEYQVILREPARSPLDQLPASATWVDSERTKLILREEDLDTGLRILLENGEALESVGRMRLTLEEFFMSRVEGEGD